MRQLKASGLDEVIPALEQPVLGICLGMQLLAEASEEDDVKCLGIIPGISRKLSASPETPVPNMGWCPTKATKDQPLLNGIGDGSYFYYVHSYALPVADYSVATATHTENFTAAIAYNNFCATQFHPERSSAAGAQVLENFLRMTS